MNTQDGYLGELSKLTLEKHILKHQVTELQKLLKDLYSEYLYVCKKKKKFTLEYLKHEQRMRDIEDRMRKLEVGGTICQKN